MVRRGAPSRPSEAEPLEEAPHAPSSLAARKIQEQHWGLDPQQFDERSVAETIASLSGPVFGPRGWFRIDVKGAERIPVAPVMLVSNHSGGTIIPDVWGFMWFWYRHFGTTRPLHPSGHELIFANQRLGRWFARRGVLHANPASPSTCSPAGGAT
nr:hypothetical protein [Deltaproteobacteria bacterium]